MGYREDGFFNINWAQDSRNASTTGGGKQNPPFAFPDKSIRFLDAQAELQRKFNIVSDTLSRGDYKIHRGYIRNLEQPHFGNVPISRCSFQFNPQEIRQSVSMREDMYLPILQDVKQLQQPVGAVVNFTFDLLFDRSHELSAGTSRSGLTADQVERGQSANDPSVDPLNPNPDKDPYDIGVLADLRVLYSVIGQGFSREMLEFQKSRLVDAAERVNGTNQPEDTDTGEGGSTSEGTETSSSTTTSSLGEIDDVALNEILEANYGNWGLLMPNPVRVMFSSLFMLDGFITGTNVDFLKFNTKMVPLMCRVTVNMSAMYIGFARQDTFLTRQFKDAAKALEEERQENEATRSEILSALLLTGNKFGFATAWSDTSTFITSWDAVVRNGNNPLPLWTLVVNDNAGRKSLGGPGRGIFVGFPNVIPKEGGYDETLPDGTVVRRGADEDYILKLYEEGLSFNVSYSWDVSIYGGILQSTALSQSAAQSLVNSKSYQSNAQIKLLGKYGGTETSSSKEQWGSGTSGDGVKAERVRRRSIRGNDKVRNQAIGPYQIHGAGDGGVNDPTNVPPWLKNAYYVVETTLNIAVTYGSSSDELSISRDYVDVLSGNSNLRKLVNLNWSTTTDTSGSPSVQLSNGLFLT